MFNSVPECNQQEPRGNSGGKKKLSRSSMMLCKIIQCFVTKLRIFANYLHSWFLLWPCP